MIRECYRIFISIQAEKEHTPPINVPPMSKPSVYHMVHTPNTCTTVLLLCVLLLLKSPCQQVSQPSLTEAMLQRHNETETAAPKLSFAGKTINVNNRYMYMYMYILLYAVYNISLYAVIYKPAGQHIKWNMHLWSVH